MTAVTGMQTGDRRTVTVLFADISDFTGIAEQLDPEEVIGLVRECFGELVEVARAWEGGLEKHIGDALLTVFGAPASHEDDPARAVHAALAMQERMHAINRRRRPGTPELHLHVGINTGLVVMGPSLDAQEQAETIVIGDTVNTAKRLQEAAEAGQILVGEATYTATEHDFDYRELRPLAVKGKQGRIAAYRCLRRHAVRVEHPIRSDLVGRERELGALLGAVERLEQRRGGLVVVSGEAGLGKSRLVADARLHAPDRVRWLAGRALPFGRTISYWPFVEIIKSDAGIVDEDPDAERWAKLERRVEMLFGEQADELLPYLAALLALEPRRELAEQVRHQSGEARGRQIFRASRRYFERLADEGPLALVFEDWHWADASSDELLRHLLPLAQRSALLFCCLTRPDGPRLPGGIEIKMSALTAEQTERLACNLLDLDDLPLRVRDALYRKTEGNPFFVEEVVRSLIDLGAIVRDEATGGWQAQVPVTEVALPETLRGVIMARVDRLDENVKEPLRLAAVIGRTFYDRVLRTVARDAYDLDESLAELRALDLIRVESTVPELEYAFKHALTRDAVYESILHRRRAELHRRVATCIESLFDDRIDEFLSLLAYHYAESEDWERALHYVLAAGDRAGAMAADSEALVHYRRAHEECLRIFGSGWEPLKRAQLERKMGEALQRRGDHQEADEFFQRALRHLGSPYPDTRFRIRLAIVAQLLRQAGHRIVPMLAVRREAEIDPVVAERTENYHLMSWLHYFVDREKMVLDAVMQLNVSERHGHIVGMSRGSDGAGIISDVIPLPRIATYYHRRAVELAQRSDDPTALALAYLGLCAHDHCVLGRWDDALRHAELSAEIYRQAGDVRGWGVSRRMLSAFLAYRGDFARAVDTASEIVNVAEDAAHPQVLGWGLHALGIALWRAGDLPEAHARLEQAIAVLRSVPDHRAAVMAIGDLGHCLLEEGRVEDAVPQLEEARTLMTELGLRGFSCTPVATALAEAYLAVAERAAPADRRAALRKARRASRAARRQAKIDTTSLPAAYRMQGTYCWLRGRRRRAARWWRRSLAVSEKLGARHDLGLTALERGRRLGTVSDLRLAQETLSAIGARGSAARALTLSRVSTVAVTRTTA